MKRLFLTLLFASLAIFATRTAMAVAWLPQITAKFSSAQIDSSCSTRSQADECQYSLRLSNLSFYSSFVQQVATILLVRSQFPGQTILEKRRRSVKVESGKLI